MDRDYAKELSNFEAVWDRVRGSAKKSSGSAPLMPKKANKSKAVRFRPPR